MEDSLTKFNREISRFAKKLLPKEVVKFHKQVVLDALRLLVAKTPVDTGRARANWQATIGSPATGAIGGDFPAGKGPRKTTLPPLGDEDKATIAKGLAEITLLPPYTVVWISNNVDYIEELEHGSSRQTPHGMMAVTVEELNEMLKDAD